MPNSSSFGFTSKFRQKGPNYGYWSSWKILLAFGVIAVVFFALSFLFYYLLIGAVIAFAEFAFLAFGRYQMSTRGANMQVKLWDKLVDHLDWDGNGRVIDIGCGSGAVAIRVAKKYPSAQVVGVDYWGKMWEYSKEQCEQNARVEGVNNQVLFQKGDAAKLSFEDGFFDAAVSNDTFHNVMSAKDKSDVLKEALRVVKKGGAFAFQDAFIKRYYHSGPDELLNTIRSWGVEKVHMVKTLDSMLTIQAYLIWGIK